MNKLSTVAYSVIVLVVVVILIATIAIPVIESSTQTLRTEANNDSEVYTVATSTEEITVSLDGENPGYLINGTHFDHSQRSVLIFSDNFYILTYQVSGNPRLTMIDTTNGVSESIASTSAVVTIANGGYTYGETTGTINGDIYYVNTTGAYGEFKSVEPINFNEDSKLMFFGTITFTINDVTTNYDVNVYGTINDLKIKTLYSTDTSTEVSTDGFSVSMDESKIVEKDGYYQLLSASDIPTITYTDGDNVYTAALKANPTNVWFAPIKYLAYQDVGITYMILLSIIPTLLIMVPVLIAANLVTGNRRD